MMKAHFVAPFPVSVNKVYTAWYGRVMLTPKAREYKDKVSRDLKQLIQENAIPKFGDRRTSVHYVVIAPDHRDRDLANLDKVLSDSLTKAGVFQDDSCIDDHRFTRGPVEPGEGRVEIFITEIPRGELWRLN